MTNIREHWEIGETKKIGGYFGNLTTRLGKSHYMVQTCGQQVALRDDETTWTVLGYISRGKLPSSMPIRRDNDFFNVDYRSKSGEIKTATLEAPAHWEKSDMIFGKMESPEEELRGLSDHIREYYHFKAVPIIKGDTSVFGDIRRVVNAIDGGNPPVEYLREGLEFRL